MCNNNYRFINNLFQKHSLGARLNSFIEKFTIPTYLRSVRDEIWKHGSSNWNPKIEKSLLMWSHRQESLWNFTANTDYDNFETITNNSKQIHIQDLKAFLLYIGYFQAMVSNFCKVIYGCNKVHKMLP